MSGSAFRKARGVAIKTAAGAEIAPGTLAEWLARASPRWWASPIGRGQQWPHAEASAGQVGNEVGRHSAASIAHSRPTIPAGEFVAGESALAD